MSRARRSATVKLLFSLVLVIVISIYMLLYMPSAGARRSTGASRREPGTQPLLQRIEHALASYVKGQVLLSLIIGTSAGLGIWLLGHRLGLLPGGDKYALLFGAWVAFMELIPYLGPVARRDAAVRLRARRRTRSPRSGSRCSSSASTSSRATSWCRT